MNSIDDVTNEVPSDNYRDRETVNHLKAIAGGIFARYGIEFATARRAGGWTNATWLAGGLALRLSVHQGNQKIRREAQLASLLPVEVGYPLILETGMTDDYEWSLSREIQGQNLGEVWPALGWEERSAALRQLWQKAQAVHTVNTASVAGLARQRAWFNSNDPEEAAAGLTRLVQQKVLADNQAGSLRETLERFWKVLPSASCVLNHGDLTIDNALWYAGRVVSLLDFEYALVAPAELDLNALLSFSFAPPEIDQVLSDSDRDGLQRMRQAVVDLTAPVLAHPGSKVLLLGYATLLALWKTEDYLAHPEGEGPMEQWQPYRMLVSLADGQGGYLAPFLEQVSFYGSKK